MSLRAILLPLILSMPLPAFGQEKPANKIRTLPGAQADGSVRLPNTWSIKPVGKQIELGDFPVNVALHPGGKWLAVLHAGYGDHEIMLVELDAKKTRVRSRVILDQTFVGLTFSPDGKQLFASGGEFDLVHMFDFEDGFLSRQRKLPIPPTKSDKFIPGGLAVHPNGKSIFVAGVWGHGVCLLPTDNPKDGLIVPLGEDSFPNSCLVDAKGKRLLCQPVEQVCRRGSRSRQEGSRANFGDREASDRNALRPR